MDKYTNTEYNEQLEQKKRIMMKKKKKRRAKRRLIIFLFVLICAGIIFTALKAPFFDIKEIVCAGKQKLTDEQITKIAGISTGANIFSTSVRTAEENLVNNPEIAEANVQRVFPNKMRIEIKEAVPVAYAAYGNRFLLINGTGEIIKITENSEDELLKNLVEIVGIEVAFDEAGKSISAEDDKRALKLYDCLSILSKLGMREQVKVLDFSDLSDIKLDYENRIDMLLGSYDNLEYKLKFVKKVIDEKISKHEKAKFDFRGEELHVGTFATENETVNKPETAENKTENPAAPEKEAGSAASETAAEPQKTETGGNGAEAEQTASPKPADSE